MNSFKYNCEKCNFVTNTLNNYNIHLSTKKHTNQEIIECKFECNICNKKYKSQSGLWRHKKNCQKNTTISNEVIEALKEQQKEINEKHQKRYRRIKEINNRINQERTTRTNHK